MPIRAHLLVVNPLPLSQGPHHPETASVVYELGCLYFVKPEALGVRTRKGWKEDERVWGDIYSLIA